MKLSSRSAAKSARNSRAGDAACRAEQASQLEVVDTRVGGRHDIAVWSTSLISMRALSTGAISRIDGDGEEAGEGRLGGRRIRPVRSTTPGPTLPAETSRPGSYPAGMSPTSSATARVIVFPTPNPGLAFAPRPRRGMIPRGGSIHPPVRG